MYSDHEKEFLNDDEVIRRGAVQESVAFRCLRDDPEAKLVIYCMSSTLIVTPHCILHK